VELGGPLPTDSAGLKRFLEQCDSVLEGMAGAIAT